MTHKELVNIAEKWLVKSKGCGFAFKEFNTFHYERPDAIGFKHNYSILVECKASRADFLSDKNKLFRLNPRLGLGTYRFYMCPKEVIKPEDLPEKWGLVWVSNSKAKQIIGPKGNIWEDSGEKFRFNEKNINGEMVLLKSALRRLYLQGNFNLIYESF